MGAERRHGQDGGARGVPVERLRDALAQSGAIEGVLGRRGIASQRAGRGELKACCPVHQERSPSFWVSPSKGVMHCFGCGWSGDAIDLVMTLERLDFPGAVRQLAGELGLAEGVAAPPRVARAAPAPGRGDSGSPERVRRILACCQSAAGSVVETYLREARGLPLDRIGGVPARLLCHPALPVWDSAGDRPVEVARLPAMVAPILSLAGDLLGCHVTWLAADGSGKAVLRGADDRPIPARKIIRAAATWMGGAARLVPAPPGGGRMLLGEGIETVLAGACLIGPGWGCWAALSLGNLAGGQDRAQRVLTPAMDSVAVRLPGGVRVLGILADNDMRDRAQARRAATLACLRHGQARAADGSRVRAFPLWPAHGRDWNDELLADAAGAAATLARQVVA